MRRLEAHDALRYEDILRIADQAKNDRDKALIYVLWLTGARISEALRLTLDDVRIDVDEDGRKVLVFEIFTLKRRDHPTRAIPVYLDHPEDGKLARWLVNYFKGLAQKNIKWLFPDLRSFDKPINRKHAWRILKQLDERLHCHLLRHSRLTEKARKRMGAFHLQKLAGWTDLRPAMRYIHLDYSDLQEEMKR